MVDDLPRSRTARKQAESALARVVQHYGQLPDLRGTRFAARDRVVRELEGSEPAATVYVAGLAGFLLAKSAAAYGRRKPKDWYDLAFVLLHNDEGGPAEAADLVRSRFSADLNGEVATALRDLAANFAVPSAQGPAAYVEQLLLDHPDLDADEAAADALTAVTLFCTRLAE